MRLTMAARLAAARFASSRRGAGRRCATSWHPALLRWRRGSKRARTERSASRGGKPASAGARWISHVHLHLSWTASERRRSEQPRALSSIAGKREGERVRGRAVTVFRCAVGATRRAEGVRRAHELAAVAAARSIVPSSSPMADHRGAAARSPLFFPAYAVRQVEAARTGHGAVLRRVSPMKSAASQPIAGRATRTVRELAAGSVVYPRRRAVIPPPADDRVVATQAAFRRPPDLVWRAALPDAQTATGKADDTPTPSSARVDPRTGSSPEPSGRETRDAVRTALQPRDLDPALLDRLTDDVIRRVERRVRIERERRGM